MNAKCTGFTLVELLVVVLVLAVTTGLAVPAFSAMLERNRATAAFHQLTASLAGARIAAVHSGGPVTLCPTQDGLSCRRDLVWDEGWMSYQDPGRNEQPRDPQDVIQHVQGPGPGLAIRSTLGRHRIRFQPSGWASGANISLRVCSRRESKLLGTVIVNNAGRPRTDRHAGPPAPCPFAP